MKGFFIVFCSILIIQTIANGEVLPVSFPGTFQDLPQEDRINFIAEGYQPFENLKVYQPVPITNEQKKSVEVQQTNNDITPGAPVDLVPDSIPQQSFPPAVGNQGSVANYTPAQPSTVSDTDYCTKHTNNDASIIRTLSGCNKLSGAQQARCTKCFNHAGTYENGRCFIEILHWFCQGTGWSEQGTRSCPDKYKYHGCGMIRKYIDAEQLFTCPQEGAISGCCQHGGVAGAKHPPFNLDGIGFYEMNCKMPLSSNLDWRVAHNNGSAIWVSGVNHATRDWCMPSSNSGPWNSYNHKGDHVHCATTISGGTVVQQWHKLD